MMSSHFARALRLRSLALSNRNVLFRALSTLPEHKVIQMPALSPTMEVGTIQEWKKKVGDAIEGGEVIAEIETDKATRSYEVNDDGFLARVFYEDGAADVPVGKPLAIIVEEESDIAAFADYVPEQTSASPAQPVPAATPPPPVAPIPAVSAAPAPPIQMPVTTSQAPTGTRIIASPLARVTAASAGLPLAAVPGTGPGGRIIAADVTEALDRGVAVPVPAQIPVMTGMPMYSDMDVTKYKRITADRLLQSKTTIPHYYLNMDCHIDEMLSLRKKINERAKDGDYKISVNDFVIKAAAAALRKVPQVNSQWLGDKIRTFHSADISIAVQTDQGLITPIVKDADRKGLKEISSNVKELAAKAKANQLAPEEFMGGTFTISNLGMFGVSSFSAIVNPPQAAILAVGTSERRVVRSEDEASGFREETVMKVTMSCDHRVIDGAVGAMWLKEFKACMENPVNMIM